MSSMTNSQKTNKKSLTQKVGQDTKGSLSKRRIESICCLISDAAAMLRCSLSGWVGGKFSDERVGHPAKNGLGAHEKWPWCPRFMACHERKISMTPKLRSHYAYHRQKSEVPRKHIKYACWCARTVANKNLPYLVIHVKILTMAMSTK